MAVGLNTPIIQIVGYQNSGRTTLVEKLVTLVAEEGLRVGTIKHHGHGGKPDLDDIGKDSDIHRQAGAVATSVEGGGVLRLHCEKSNWQLSEIIELYKLLNIDVILVEGYKMNEYPKVVLLRKKEDQVLLDKLTNIIAVISWFLLQENIKKSYKTYSLDNENYLNDILQVMRDLHE